jgi:predicted outer membrane protein
VLRDDLKTIKTIFEEYYRSEMNITDQKEIDKLFEQYIQTASIPNDLIGFVTELKDQNDNIRKDYVISDIIFDIETDFDTDM